MFKDLEANPWLSDLGKGSNKKLVEFLTKVGGWGLKWTDFPLIIFFFWKKNMSLKHWIVPKDHFKTHLFFFQFLGGGPFSPWILVLRVCQTFKAL